RGDLNGQKVPSGDGSRTGRGTAGRGAGDRTRQDRGGSVHPERESPDLGDVACSRLDERVKVRDCPGYRETGLNVGFGARPQLKGSHVRGGGARCVGGATAADKLTRWTLRPGR